ncbi:MAG: hypothetical protein PHP23_00685 [Desulfobacterales bacterium]|nr:hypothetical protein [Desulfobacterales bacterium]MDD4071602.1 hypothetical protein [Desulfobacterales bacterium]MDD4392638.1 hypothetical protein [Desulfobacterales bacterium]
MMTEADLRKWHRTSGMVLSVEDFLRDNRSASQQVQTGRDPSPAAGSERDVTEVQIPGNLRAGASSEPEEELIEEIHRGGGYAGALYRIVLGACLIGQSAGGILLFIAIYRRRHAHQ